MSTTIIYADPQGLDDIPALPTAFCNGSVGYSNANVLYIEDVTGTWSELGDGVLQLTI
jgi:hypothetical protein